LKALKSPKCSAKQLRATQENPYTDNLDSGDNTITSRDCLKFISCCAPICPLDPKSIGATYLKGERICFYMSEYSKPHSKIHSERYIRGALGVKQYEGIASAYPVIVYLYSAIKYRLKISSTKPSRIGDSQND
jgi:hypothetical protein